MTPSPESLPLVLAGPVLRRLEPQRLAIWLVGSQPLQLDFVLEHPGVTAQIDCQTVPIGRSAFIHLLDIHFEHFLNVLFFEAHLQSFPIESSAFANRAGDPNISEEIHFKTVATISFASFAPAARPVETKATFLVPTNLCFG